MPVTSNIRTTTKIRQLNAVNDFNKRFKTFREEQGISPDYDELVLHVAVAHGYSQSYFKGILREVG